MGWPKEGQPAAPAEATDAATLKSSIGLHRPHRHKIRRPRVDAS